MPLHLVWIMLCVVLIVTPSQMHKCNYCNLLLYRTGCQSYLGDWINYIEWSGILFALSIVPFRALNHPGQWIVASIAYFLNGLKIFEYSALFK